MSVSAWAPGPLRNLTSMGGLAFFLLALGLAGIGLLTGVGVLWAPTAAVVAYGLLLLYCQSSLHVRLNPTLKDSPYFLGFLLTLGGLLRVFAALKGAQEALPEVGSAVAATAAGILMRHVLLSKDPAEEMKDKLFDMMAADLRNNAATFAAAQTSLVATITEFVGTRENLFREEERAHRNYMERLTEGSSVLARIQELYPQQLQLLIKQYEDSIQRLSELSAGMFAGFSELRGQLDKALLNEAALRQEHIAAAVGLIDTQRDKLQSGLTVVAAAVQSASDSLLARAERLDEELHGFSVAEQQLTSSVAALSEGVEGARARLAVVTDGLTGLATVLRAVPASLQAAAQEMAQQGAQTHLEINDRLRAVLADVRAIDQIVDELLRVLKLRIEALSSMR